ncbi:Mediator of RNA polymerase II transcription subunit 25 [Spatholobus suberectus]|nr:Mediator of RNA polymerase II transcription subunit 25 [Spatholobus suberectus]
MANKKWLNIIVDDNSTLAPHWPNIVLECLEQIVRFDNSYCSYTMHSNHAPCELGLVMYNANSNLGMDVKYIHWIRDVNYVLGILSSLTFNGNNLNQHATYGERLCRVCTSIYMFQRPSDAMTTQEYYYGERHCVLIAAGDPVPRRMLVSAPEIQGRFIGTQLHTLKADFYEVAEMFGLGNNESPLANTPISNCRIGQITVLLSRNFKEARDALREKRTVGSPTEESVESMKRTNDIRIPIDFCKQPSRFSLSALVARLKPVQGNQFGEASSTPS